MRETEPGLPGRIPGYFGAMMTARVGRPSVKDCKERLYRHFDFEGEERERMSETGAVKAMITVSSKGEQWGVIVLRFFPDVAPNHVKNFTTLARQGFYNGTTFHRVIPGFMIQGGDPNSKNPDRATHGMGGPGFRVKAEFNSKPHKRGTVSMARSNDPDSAGSQFFICVADSHFLDWQYTVFGEVESGMDVADKVVNAKRDGRDNPLERVEMTVTVVE
jgi:peptidyl-prolyl cis-trans isomerase B (cyclophilin B)